MAANVMAVLQADSLTRDAETIAPGVSGVHSIHNELTVGAPT